MTKKSSKRIILEAVQAAIKGEVVSEGPITFAKSVAQGVKGGAQTVGGNFKANRAKSYMDQYAKKSKKDVEKFGNKAVKQAQKMKMSSHSAVKQTGEKIEDEVMDTKQRVAQVAQDIGTSFPSAVGQSTPGMQQGQQKSGPFYDWLKQTHGISSQDFHTPQRQGGIGKSMQDHLMRQYQQQSGQPQAQAPQQQGAPAVQPKAKQSKFGKWFEKHYGGQDFNSMGAQVQKQVMDQYDDFKNKKARKKLRKKAGGKGKAQQAPQQPQQAPQQPQPQQQPQAQPQPQQAPQQPQAQQGTRPVTVPNIPQQPGLKATIGDMIAQKSIPQTRERPQAGQKTASKPGLDVLGGTEKDFKQFYKALKANHPLASQTYKALKYGNVDLAKRQFDVLKSKGFGATMPGKKPPAQPDMGTAKTMPGKQFKDVVGQAAQKAVGPGTQPIPLVQKKDGTQPIPLVKKKKKSQAYTPAAPGPGPSPSEYDPPTPRQVQPQTQDFAQPGPRLRVAEPKKDEKEEENRRKQRKKNITGTESDEPIMTMADFMRDSAADPDHIEQQAQQASQEKELMGQPSRKKKKGKHLIQDRDKGARIDDKFVSSDDRKQEGY